MKQNELKAAAHTLTTELCHFISIRYISVASNTPLKCLRACWSKSCRRLCYWVAPGQPDCRIIFSSHLWHRLDSIVVAMWTGYYYDHL